MSKCLIVASIALACLVSGCATGRQHWGTKCAWDGNWFYKTRNIGEKGKKMTEADYTAYRDSRTGVINAHGYYFCTLKCLNAYEASKGIKEQRYRHIQGE